MKEYIESAKSEIQNAISSYSGHETANEWKFSEEEFKIISRKVEELIYGDGNRHTDKVSHQAIWFSCDIPNNWGILGNILYGFNTEKILPCILFTWLLNMNKKYWNRLQERITHNYITLIDERAANSLKKSKSKIGNANIESVNNEVKVVDFLFYNIFEISRNYDLAFMMVIRFLTLLRLPICAKADVNLCISWFENEYGILRHIFTYNENGNNDMRDDLLKNIIYGLSEQKNEKRLLIKYSKEFNEGIQKIKNKIIRLEFSNEDDIENKIEDLLIDFRQLNGYFLSFRYELFKANYLLNSKLSGSINHPLIQMYQFFDADLYIEELKVKIDNPQCTFVLKEVTAKIESISELYLILKPSNSDAYNAIAGIIIDDYDGENISIPVYNCKNTSSHNCYNVHLNDDSSELTYRPPIHINKLNMLYAPHDITLKGTLKILSAKYNAYDTEFKLSCDELKVDNSHMINTQFKFKDNSEVLKCKKQKDKWYNSIFLLFANEI